MRLAAQQRENKQLGQQEEQEQERPPHGERARALFFVNDTAGGFPSAASPAPLRYDPCAAAHAEAYLNREVTSGFGKGEGAVAAADGLWDAALIPHPTPSFA